jgi:hypothetical protein
MRTLSPRPGSVIDPCNGGLLAGSFRGGLPRVDPSLAGKSRLFRVAHEKRWVYVAVTAGDLLVTAVICRFGYASNSFAFVYDRADGRMVARYSAVAPPFAADVGDTGGEGCRARFRWLGADLSIARGHGERDYRLEITAPDLRVSARLSTEGMPPPIGAVAPLAGPPGLFNATEKGVLLPAVGEVVAAGRHYALDGGLGGYDFTSGLLARRTAWRWAFALGRARTAERVGLNLVQGFVGEPECALWVDGEIYPLSEGRFELDLAKPLQPWRVRTADGEVDLRFEPGAIHAETHDFGVVASRFIQPAGSYSGTLRVAGREPLELDGVLGVAEDQEVRW